MLVIYWYFLQGDDAEIAHVEGAGGDNEFKEEDEKEHADTGKEVERKEIGEGKLEDRMEKDDSQPEKGLDAL